MFVNTQYGSAKQLGITVVENSKAKGNMDSTIQRYHQVLIALSQLAFTCSNLLTLLYMFLQAHSVTI